MLRFTEDLLPSVSALRIILKVLRWPAPRAANELLNIIGIRAAFVLTEYQGKIYISARSIDEINVQRIMERLGRRRTSEHSRSSADGLQYRRSLQNDTEYAG